ncbi:unnamed protein product, partial [Ilex paraguariensis]
MPLPPSSQAALIGACASLGWAFNNQAYTPRSRSDSSVKNLLCSGFLIETISGTVVLRWVNSQLGRILGWVERAIQQERWDPISPQQRHGSSIVEVYRIVEE